MKIVISTNYWGSQGAGVIVFCEPTGNVLWVKRSTYVNEPHTWSVTVGGKLDGREKPRQAAYREIKEELAYKGRMRLDHKPVDVFKDGSFRYTTFLARVQQEFDLPPFIPWTPGEKGNWETEDYEWAPYHEPPSSNLHFGTKSLLRKVPSIG